MHVDPAEYFIQPYQVDAVAKQPHRGIFVFDLFKPVLCLATVAAAKTLSEGRASWSEFDEQVRHRPRRPRHASVVPKARASVRPTSRHEALPRLSRARFAVRVHGGLLIETTLPGSAHRRSISCHTQRLPRRRLRGWRARLREPPLQKARTRSGASRRALRDRAEDRSGHRPSGAPSAPCSSDHAWHPHESNPLVLRETPQPQAPDVVRRVSVMPDELRVCVVRSAEGANARTARSATGTTRRARRA
jgi:hypothetical protein